MPEDNFGMKLLKYRLKAGYSQMDLSKLIGVNDCTIRSWEKNKSIPNKSNLEKLRKILNV
ncbi:helix-turn-helix domain-containing protein [Clostridium cochlearium]|uniref:Putative transcription factor, MBF1 like protein n=1 Tax=Clostridium cochlearium TaxID=1494 RepID=A0A2X2VY90_CLOCO|nr:helix-turn-helix transcriptional regulator [Clostridium cochlearium]SQB33374.1 putative transcription factor, MBF1 like protein [Clostridium cochlearium]